MSQTAVKVIQIPTHAILSICLAIWFMCNEVNMHSSCPTYLLLFFLQWMKIICMGFSGIHYQLAMAVDIVHTFPKRGAKRERAVSEFTLLALYCIGMVNMT
jgi:hypothetical protein